MMKGLSIVGLMGALALFGASSAQATIIDDFNTLPIGPISQTNCRANIPVGQGTANCPAGNGASVHPRTPEVGKITSQGTGTTPVKDGPILGGVREFRLINHAISFPGAQAASTKDIGVNAAGAATLTTGTNLDASLTVWWDGRNDSLLDVDGLDKFKPTGLGGYDLKSSGANEFRFAVLGLDVDLDVTVIICQETGGACYADVFTKTVAQVQANPLVVHSFNAFKTLGRTIADLDAFLASGGDTGLGAAGSAGAANVHAALQDLGAVGFLVRANDRVTGSIDLNIDQFGTNHVPEPATIFLMGAGLVGLCLTGFLRKRRQA